MGGPKFQVTFENETSLHRALMGIYMLIRGQAERPLNSTLKRIPEKDVITKLYFFNIGYWFIKGSNNFGWVDFKSANTFFGRSSSFPTIYSIITSNADPFLKTKFSQTIGPLKIWEYMNLASFQAFKMNEQGITHF